MPSKFDGWIMRRLSVEDRIMSRVYMKPDCSCWFWRGIHDRDGYAKMTHRNRPIAVYRLAYETFKAPIPDGMEMDHICRERGCVNPSHVEPVTSRENTLRSPIAPAAINARMEKCPNGHEFSVVKFGKRTQRRCLICSKRRRQEYFQENKDAITAARREKRHSLKNQDPQREG